MVFLVIKRGVILMILNDQDMPICHYLPRVSDII